MRSVDLRLNAGGTGGSAGFTDLYTLILNHDRVTYDLLEERPSLHGQTQVAGCSHGSPCLYPS